MAPDVAELRGAWEEACRIEEETLQLFLNARTLRALEATARLLVIAENVRKALWEKLLLAYLNPPQPKFPAWCDA